MSDKLPIMAITRTSTQDEIVGQYLDNLNYDANDSTSEAWSFVAACRGLLVIHPSSWVHTGSSIGFDPNLWQTQLVSAKDWIVEKTQRADNPGGVTHLSFGGTFR